MYPIIFLIAKKQFPVLMSLSKAGIRKIFRLQVSKKTKGLTNIFVNLKTVETHFLIFLLKYNTHTEEDINHKFNDYYLLS